MKHILVAFVLSVASLVCASNLDQDPILEWSGIAAECIREDYNGLRPPDNVGPTFQSRAMAVVHLAMYDAINSIMGTKEKAYLTFSSSKKSSVNAAVATAAAVALKKLYPSQIDLISSYYSGYMSLCKDAPGAVTKGVKLGRRCANKMVTKRTNDGSETSMEYHPLGTVGDHDVDPYNPDQGFLTPQWGYVEPFFIQDATMFRASSDEQCLDTRSVGYAKEIRHLERIGKDDSKTRTDDELEQGIFWAYDGAIKLGTPGRLLLQITHQILKDQKTSVYKNAEILAMATLALADTDIVSWESKYHFRLWRPVLGIHGADKDKNAGTKANPDWRPYGAPKSNTVGGSNFNPNFPTYPSGHSSAAGVLFHLLRRVFGTDEIPFSFVSDEMNGKTTDNNGIVRSRKERKFNTLWQAATEMALSRVYIGIHFECDCLEGLDQGKRVADYIFDGWNKKTVSDL